MKNLHITHILKGWGCLLSWKQFSFSLFRPILITIFFNTTSQSLCFWFHHQYQHSYRRYWNCFHDAVNELFWEFGREWHKDNQVHLYLFLSLHPFKFLIYGYFVFLYFLVGPHWPQEPVITSLSPPVGKWFCVFVFSSISLPPRWLQPPLTSFCWQVGGLLPQSDCTKDCENGEIFTEMRIIQKHPKIPFWKTGFVVKEIWNESKHLKGRISSLTGGKVMKHFFHLCRRLCYVAAGVKRNLVRHWNRPSSGSMCTWTAKSLQLPEKCESASSDAQNTNGYILTCLYFFSAKKMKVHRVS